MRVSLFQHFPPFLMPFGDSLNSFLRLSLFGGERFRFLWLFMFGLGFGIRVAGERGSCVRGGIFGLKSRNRGGWTCGPLVDVSGDPTRAKSIPHLHSVQSVLQLHICPSSLRLRYHASLIPSFSLTYLLLPLCIFYVAHMAAPRRVTHFWSSATPMLLRCERLDTKIVLGAFKGGLQSDRRPA